MTQEFTEAGFESQGRNLRLETLVNVRWLAVLGQTTAVLIVWLVLDFEFLPAACFALIAASAFLNAFLAIRYPANTRLSERASRNLLNYDIVQLALLLYLTGGLGNPFSFLLLVPVFISATALSVRTTIFLGMVSLSSATILAFYYLPLPWNIPSGLELPWIYIAGMWFAVASSLLFTAVYAFRVADEARQLADALTATELVLQREQYLSNIDGLAAAAAHELGTPLATIALVTKELLNDLPEGSSTHDDLKLLKSQADRCRDIMQTLTSLSAVTDQHIGIVPFSVIVEEVCQPHRNFGVEIDIQLERDENEPKCFRNPGILYGLGNIVENAVDHASEKVVVEAGWDDAEIQIRIGDDGYGFDEETIHRIGEPFLQSRSNTKKGSGLGLGLFIAKTLLERSGARIAFGNSRSMRIPGARVIVTWPRSLIETPGNNSHIA